MLSIKHIRENTEEVKTALAKKSVKPVLIDEVIALDKKQRDLQKIVEGYRAEQNIVSEEIQRTADNGERNVKINQMQTLKTEIKKLEPELEKVSADLREIMLKLPNLPMADVPVGKDESENQVIRKWGEIPQFDFAPKDYLTLAEELDIIDVKRAAKVSGARFGYLKGAGALLELSLTRLAFETIVPRGFSAVIPPVLIKEEMMRGMGYIDRHEDREESYFLPEDKLYLVGTSEQSVGTLHAGEILNKDELPKRYVAFSACFRREAGSHGKDTKGILRVHQFDKIEMLSLTTPEKSEEEHKLLLSLEEELMQKLGIPYRALSICTGDLGNTAAKKYDIEAWMPGQNDGQGEYRETHSTSNTTDFQTRRLNIKYKDPGVPGLIGGGIIPVPPSLKYAHMLNGTGFAIGRMIIAIIENYQQKDGSIRIPEVLQPFMMGMEEIRSRASAL